MRNMAELLLMLANDRKHGVFKRCLWFQAVSATAEVTAEHAGNPDFVWILSSHV